MPGTSTQPLALRHVNVTEPPARPTLAAFAAAWMGEQRALAEGGLLRISTLHRYQTALRAHLLPFFGALAVDEITRQRCDRFRIAATTVGRLNPATVNSVVQILRVILRAAQREGHLDRDPLIRLRPLPVIRRLIEPYTRTEIHRLLEATPPRDRLVIALAALAGLRQGEVYAIRACDLDLDQRRLLVRRSLQRHHPGFSLQQRLGPPKTATGFRHAPIQASLHEVIDQHL